MRFIKRLLCFCFLATSILCVAQEEETDYLINKAPFTIGETVTIFSKILNEERVLNIYLPNAYDASKDKRYPVIYLLDGSTDEDFIHIAGLVQFGSFSWINMIPETIVIGIANVDRKRDFTYPSNNERDKKEFPTTGGSEKFIDFIQNELFQFIEIEYQVSKEKTIIGQSLGGLLATEILLNKPELFDNYIIVSPSLWWDDESLLKKTINLKSAPKSIYVAVGKEGEIMERVANELHLKLKELSLPNTKLFYKFLDEQNHGDALHLAVYDAFEKIFRKKQK
ncbi:MAG: alpha/beta hydrolase [Flavobacteriaceae bacterium]|nr:alpha/beta hydrolase [Flavobacteriaceae bacterium]